MTAKPVEGSVNLDSNRPKMNKTVEEHIMQSNHRVLAQYGEKTLDLLTEIFVFMKDNPGKPVAYTLLAQLATKASDLAIMTSCVLGVQDTLGRLNVDVADTEESRPSLPAISSAGKTGLN
jgi:hypothetical protein